MIRIEIDCNWREDMRTIVLPEARVAEFGLQGGERVILHEPGMECEAIVRCGKQWPWVADVIEGTIKDLPIDDRS
jgi:hypothetical protein